MASIIYERRSVISSDPIITGLCKIERMNLTLSSGSNTLLKAPNVQIVMEYNSINKR